MTVFHQAIIIPCSQLLLFQSVGLEDLAVLVLDEADRWPSEGPLEYCRQVA